MRFRILLCAAFTGLLVTGWTVANPRLLGRWLDVGEPPREADYVLVLSGDNNARPFVAAELLSQGLADKIVITRPAVAKSVDLRVPVHETASQVLRRLGVKSEQIVLLEESVDSTFDEARVAREFFATRANSTLMVVTSFFHTRRARWIVSRMLADQVGRVSFVSAPFAGVTSEDWWHHEDGFSVVLSEYLKLGYYGLRYSHYWRWFAGTMALSLLIVMNYGVCRSAFVWLKQRVAMGGARRHGTDNPGHVAGRLICWSLVFLLAFVFWQWRGPLLQRVACGLTMTWAAKEADYIVIRSADGLHPSVDQCYDAAARLYREDAARRVVLVSARSCPVVRIGAAPTFFDLSRRELATRGVAVEAIICLQTDATTRKGEAVALGEWLDQQVDSSSRCVFLCNGFDSRSWRYLFDRANQQLAAERVDVLGLTNRGIDEANWWRTRHGLTATFGSYAKLAYCYFHKERRSG